ncbi:hypothetical protein ARMGADRAFT_1168495 [Armillaria gallica]|uniref:Peptidase M24 domain-containing protein n=1 Tax=Armillaria gallica TaxID=47427 RepID=A0A2H3CWN4_ARMGA|nr:hypothetical protein ARMGADRAFT_1168495 [Armillaria gallica]
MNKTSSNCSHLGPLPASEFHTRRFTLGETLTALDASGTRCLVFRALAPLRETLLPIVDASARVRRPNLKARAQGRFRFRLKESGWSGWRTRIQLPDIEGTVFVDGSIRHFIVDGLRTAFPKAMVIAAPIEIRQVPERKSEGELVLLKCTNEDKYTSICISASVSPMPDNSSCTPSPTLASKTAKMPPFPTEAAPAAALALMALPCLIVPPPCMVIGATSPALALPASTILDTRIQIWNFVHSAQNIAFQIAYAGVVAKRIDETPRLFLGLAYAKYFMHRLGHGSGLEVHEDPNLNDGSRVILQTGHAFSHEPGVYIEGKVGVRLEDCFYIAQNGSAVYLASGVGGPASSPWKTNYL